MVKNLIFAASWIFCSFLCDGQDPIEIASNTVKISASGEQKFYYGFQEGDQVVFSLEEINGKELNEVEIAVSPSATSLFMDYKTKKIEKKIINIPETGIYQFRFSNSNFLAARVCRYSIQRIPSAEAAVKFNSTVFKKLIYDTVYADVNEPYLIRTDTVAVRVLDQLAKVHSTTNPNGNKVITNFALPPNTIAWSYYLGVDQAGQQAFENASKQLAQTAGPLLTKLSGGDPLMALGLGLTSYLARLQTGEDVDYWLTDAQNASAFLNQQQFSYFKTGKVINDFAAMPAAKGNLVFCLHNDNAITPIQVVLKVTAIQAKQIWGTHQVRKMAVSSKEVMYLKN